MRAKSARKAPLNACFASKNAEGVGGAFVVCGRRRTDDARRLSRRVNKAHASGVIICPRYCSWVRNALNCAFRENMIQE